MVPDEDVAQAAAISRTIVAMIFFIILLDPEARATSLLRVIFPFLRQISPNPLETDFDVVLVVRLDGIHRRARMAVQQLENPREIDGTAADGPVGIGLSVVVVEVDLHDVPAKAFEPMVEGHDGKKVVMP